MSKPPALPADQRVEVLKAKRAEAKAIRAALPTKSEAKRIAQETGKLTREAIDKHSLDRKAFGLVTGLAKTDEAKRQGTIRAFIDYIERAGFLDQMDAFSDVSEQVIALADRLKGRIPNRERDSDGTVAAVLN